MGRFAKKIARPLAVSDHSIGNGARWLSAIVNSAEDAIIGTGLDGIVVNWNAAAERLLGYSADEILRKPIFELCDPAFPDEIEELMQSALAGKRVTAHETTWRRKDASTLHVSLTFSLVFDESGGLIGYSIILRDITARKARDAHLQDITDDLKHRTDNLLSLVVAYIRLTKCSTVPEFREATIRRVDALAAANATLNADDWRQAKLLDLLHNALEFVTDRKDAIVLRGPDVSLRSASVQTWALAVHELATNSLKYGALSVEGGVVLIVWGIDEKGLWFHWRESGGPPTAAPSRTGLGLRLIRSGIEGHLGGAVRYDWADTGFNCEIRLPEN